MKLYWFPGSCSLAPHIALHEIGAKFDLAKVDLFTKQMENGESYLSVNPRGALPALRLDNGEILTEAAVILQYIADLKPDAKLMPQPGNLDRYRLLEWLNHLASDVHKTFSVLINPAAPEDFKALMREQLSRHFARIDEQLESADYLYGGQFSIADCYLFAMTGWTAYAGVDLAPWPALVRYRDRIAARPSVQAAMKAEGLIQ